MTMYALMHFHHKVKDRTCSSRDLLQGIIITKRRKIALEGETEEALPNKSHRKSSSNAGEVGNSGGSGD